MTARMDRRLYGPAPNAWMKRSSMTSETLAMRAADVGSPPRLLRTVLGGLLAGATLFRSVTQRSDERRSGPWKRLMLDVFTALLTTNEDQIRGLRFRPSS